MGMTTTLLTRGGRLMCADCRGPCADCRGPLTTYPLHLYLTQYDTWPEYSFCNPVRNVVCLFIYAGIHEETLGKATRFLSVDV
jgi:hypothetical protein